MTNELPFVYQALGTQGRNTNNREPTALRWEPATINLHTGEPCQRQVDGVVIVGFRRANTDLYCQLTDQGAYANALAHEYSASWRCLGAGRYRSRGSQRT